MTEENSRNTQEASGRGDRRNGNESPVESRVERKPRKRGGSGEGSGNGNGDSGGNGNPGRKARSADGPSADARNVRRNTRTSNQRGARQRKKGPELRIIPLGGLDGIGKNMTAFDCNGDIIVVDAGLMFPDDEQLGIDLILPDYTFLLENAERIRGIIITHGHEDHTGALPYLMKDLALPVPIYGSKLTLGLIEGKFKEHRVDTSHLTQVSARETLNLGCFQITTFVVNHSIPGAYGLFIKTPAGTVLHTGDFKLDQTPIDGIRTDFESIAHFGHVGVDLMMADSTNAQRPGFTKSEAEVGEALRGIIKNARRRVVVASFSSHIHRVQQICDAAKAAGRKVAVTGRSMLTNTEIAQQLGYLEVDDDLIVDSYEIKGMPPEKLVILCTGSQGEPLSALSRIASGEHRTVDIEAGDTVIISATPVPGNEKAVTKVVNQLSKVGADIFDKNRALVHVSGHASQEELKIMLAMVNPRYFMPVHGEAAHLKAHAELARKVGVDQDKVIILDNGDSLVMSNHEVKRGESVESGVIFVDGLSVGDTDQVVLRDRQVLASDGIATVVVMLDAKTHKPVGDVELIMRGVSGGDEQALHDEARDVVREAIKRSSQRGGHALQREVRDALSKLIWKRCHRRPMVLPIVMDV